MTEEVKTPRIVTMNDGTTVDFGLRDAIAGTVDETSLTISVVTGEKIVLNFDEIPQHLVVKAALEGVYRKVKANLGNDEATFAEKLAASIALIKEGKWSLRTRKEKAPKVPKISDDAKLAAVAAVVVGQAAAVWWNPIYEQVVIDVNGKKLFTDAELTPEVAQAVKDHWDNMERRQKSYVKRSHGWAKALVDRYEAGLATA